VLKISAVAVSSSAPAVAAAAPDLATPPATIARPPDRATAANAHRPVDRPPAGVHFLVPWSKIAALS
jgi:hypothetical protein